MNRYSIDQYLFYNAIDIRDIKQCNVTLCRVEKIEKINIDGGHSSIIYTVKFIKAINYKLKERISGPKELSEGCLHTSMDVLIAIHEKATNK